VNAIDRAASGTGPPFLFIADESPDADFLDVREILDHAHAILGSIALIQVFQPVARKAVASKTVFDFTLRYFLAILDSTRDAGFGFDAVVASATGARLLVPSIGHAETAVHAAWSDQRLWDRMGLYRFSRQSRQILFIRTPADA
jgi:hypothetical protein